MNRLRTVRPSRAERPAAPKATLRPPTPAQAGTQPRPSLPSGDRPASSTGEGLT